MKNNEVAFPRLLSMGEVGELIPLSKTTLYDMARRGDIPGVVYFGRRVLFDEAKIYRWIDSGGFRNGGQ